MKKTIILVFTTFLIIISYFCGYRMNKCKNENSLNKYLNNLISSKKHCNSYQYYFFFIVSPMDCPACIQFIKSKKFVINLKSVMKKNNKKVFIEFIIYGNIEKEEKNEFVKNIKDEVGVTFEKRKIIEVFLTKSFGKVYTPLVIILNHSGRMKYWRTFYVKGMDYERPYLKFINSLGGML